MKQCFEQTKSYGLRGGKLLFQLVAQHCQFSDLRDDPMLLGEGWERNWQRSKVAIVDCWICLPTHFIFNTINKKWTPQYDPQVPHGDEAKTVQNREGGADDWSRLIQ
jgi:hypothetical protein